MNAANAPSTLPTRNDRAELPENPCYESLMLNPTSLDSVTDDTLLCQFGDLVRQDREGSAQLLRLIEAIDLRKLWARLGYPSMFCFLVDRYHMSESTAAKRIGAARAARRFPILFAMVQSGEIHLSGIHKLKTHLTRENHEQVLADAKHKTIRQIEEIVARLAPRPDVPTTLRALPNRTNAPSTFAAPPPASPVPAPVDSLSAAAPAPLPARRDPDPAPLSPGRYRLQLTISQATRDKFNELRDLLAHQIPNGDPAAIVERALDALLKQVRQSKTGVTDRPRSHKPTASARHFAAAGRSRIKAAVRREVWPRDDGRCGFVGEDGHRCNETRGLEFAHVQPWAKGGADTPNNLGLRCITHNAFEAERDYGTGFMATKRKRRPLKVREPIARYVLRRNPAHSCDSREPLGDLENELLDANPAASSAVRRGHREAVNYYNAHTITWTTCARRSISKLQLSPLGERSSTKVPCHL